MQLSSRGGATSSAADVARSIWANEGPRGFVKGLSPALLRASTYGSLRIGMYEPIKETTASLAGLGPGEELPLPAKVREPVIVYPSCTPLCTLYTPSLPYIYTRYTCIYT